ncbi:MAG: UDP-N-acetylglucosamine 2-epimerase (non-hydrolyzing) [Candidatus Orphnella occulta]|nr:UDP-N-acetylglucosamine 2-epimerase (non-hydrolyzing) [Candidatus Orphnella occulta]
MLVLHVVGARPNFMKAAPVIEALSKKENVFQLLVHTGQHYNTNMSDIFFDQLGLPEPDINLEVGSDSHAVQTANIMVRIESILLKEKPDIVVVYGDVNSTVAVAIVCAKLIIPVAHVESGLRSFDRTMPEEVNRILTDQVADLLFTPSIDGNENLLREGINPVKIHFVGNVMIDTLVRLLPKAKMPTIKNLPNDYALVTLHRPSNVDDPQMLVQILKALEEINSDIPIVFPIHPRTRKLILSFDINVDFMRGRMIDPVGYLEFLFLQKNATAVITDSGGIQEETTYLGVPCLTVRENTERPVTVDIGTNILVGQDMDRLCNEMSKILKGRPKKGAIPDFWDGKAGLRIADIIVSRK